MLSPKRDLIAAKLFLRLALSGGVPPRVINVDGHPAYPSAVVELKQAGELGGRCRCRTSPYMNNRARSSIHQEADHGEPRFPFGGGRVSKRSKVTRRCMQFEKGRSAGSRRAILSVNVSSSIPFSASQRSSFPGTTHSPLHSPPRPGICNRTVSSASSSYPVCSLTPVRLDVY